MGLRAMVPGALSRGAGALLLVFLGASLATSVGAHGGDRERIHACVNQTGGTIRIIGPSEVCRDDEAPLDWSIQGPTGVSGLEVVSVVSAPDRVASKSLSAPCTPGKLVLSGGYDLLGYMAGVQIVSNRPASSGGSLPSGWFVSGEQVGTPTDWQLRVFAVCALGWPSAT